jgi:hypothetical protein
MASERKTNNNGKTNKKGGALGIKAKMRVRKPRIVINHPRKRGPDNTVSTSFAAFGRAYRCVEVIGYITDPAQGNTVVAVGTTLAQPLDWVIFFDGLPNQRRLILHVLGIPLVVPGQTAPVPVTVSRRFRTRDSFGATISWPLSNNNDVPSTFSAYGTGGNTGQSVAGTVEGPDLYSGTMLKGPPSWVVKFTGVDPGNPYELNVYVGGVAANPPSTKLTIVQG